MAGYQDIIGQEQLKEHLRIKLDEIMLETTL